MTMQEPEIFEQPRTHFVGLSAPFISILSPDANNMEVIPELWERFVSREQSIPGRKGDASYGVVYWEPEEKRSHPHELHYLCGVMVEEEPKTVPEGMICWTLPPTRFAKFLHTGPIHGIGDTVSEAYKEWLPQSSYHHADVADIEMYDQRFDPQSESSVMEYWISVRE